jgi:flagellar basal body-associated protein FliL
MEGWILAALIFLACPVGMGLMMWFMNKRMEGHNMGQAANMQGNTVSPQERLALLEAEKQVLERQIELAKQDGNPESGLPTR